MKEHSARVFVPATVGNVGPGFDVLGLAVEGLGDTISVTLAEGPSAVTEVTGRNAADIPRVPVRNCAVVAALSLLKRVGDSRGVLLKIDRQLPVSGGLGSSAAASVGGAFAAATAGGHSVAPDILLAAALDGEASVAGRHLDNIAPALFGGLCVVVATDPPQVARVPIKGDWWVALVSPAAQLATKKARSVLPSQIEQTILVHQMGATAALVTAFTTGDYELARLSLIDRYAEPHRAPLIERFAEVKRAAVDAGALGCSISGAGPTVFALCAAEARAKEVCSAMVAAFKPTSATGHVGRVARHGAKSL